MDSIEEKLIEILLDNGISFKENSTGELIFDKCYNCGRAKKLYVSKENGLFTCFRCNEKGNAVKLVAKSLNISFKEAKDKLYGKEHDQVDASYEATKKEIEQNLENAHSGLILNLGGLRRKSIKNELKLPDPIKLEEDYIILTKDTNPEAFEYLINRGYSIEDIKKLKLYVLPYKNYFDCKKHLEKKYKVNFELKTDEEKDNIEKLIKKLCLNQGRIVFPLYIEGEIYGFVARDYTGKKIPKVLNSTGNFRSYYFWNFDSVKESNSIIICEGTSSAVKCGISRSIALLGKVATPGQLKLLRKTKAKKIYFCLDIDTDDEQLKIFEELNVFYAGSIFKIELPPVIKFKDEITQNISQFLKGINYSISNELLYILPEERLKIKDNLFPKLQYNKILTETEKEIIFYIGKTGEYKDSGDYSVEEMEEFVQNAKPFN